MTITAVFVLFKILFHLRLSYLIKFMLFLVVSSISPFISCSIDNPDPQSIYDLPPKTPLHWVDLGWQDGGTGFGRRFRHHHRRWGRSQRCRSSNHLGAGLVDVVDMRAFRWAGVLAHRFVGLIDPKNDLSSFQVVDTEISTVDYLMSADD